ncbi:SCA7, zinc-binding domain-containing protein [Dipodascopsis uninucleata]
MTAPGTDVISADSPLVSSLSDNALLSKVFGADKLGYSASLKLQFSLPSLSSSSSSSSSSSVSSVASQDTSLSSSISSASDSDEISRRLNSESTWLEYAKSLEDEDALTANATQSPPSHTESPSPYLDSKDRYALSSSHPLNGKLEYGICKHCGKPFLLQILVDHVRQCIGSDADRKSKHNGQPDKQDHNLAVDSSKSKDSIKLSSGGGRSSNEAKGSSGNSNMSSSKNGASSGASGSGGNGNGGNSNGNGHNDHGKGDKPPKGKKGDDSKKDKDKEGKDSTTKTTKKRKADTNGESPMPKKKKKQPVKATPKPKGPVDVERQCGVPLPNGGFCARSLTCKSHSMGAKRNVPGRSQPYDVLLAAYQKKNQMKQAALTSSAQLAEDMELANGPVDSDEEVESVMMGVQRAYPIPMEHKIIMPVRIKHHFFRMREMFANAFSRQM